jgi:hypothetical protein
MLFRRFGVLGKHNLRKNNLALRVHDTYDAIVDTCCKAWTDLLATPQRIASITSRRWAELS